MRLRARRAAAEGRPPFASGGKRSQFRSPDSLTSNPSASSSKASASSLAWLARSGMTISPISGKTAANASGRRSGRSGRAASGRRAPSARAPRRSSPGRSPARSPRRARGCRVPAPPGRSFEGRPARSTRLLPGAETANASFGRQKRKPEENTFLRRQDKSRAGTLSGLLAPSVVRRRASIATLSA